CATAELLAPLEQRLVADANAEEWFARLDKFSRSVEQFLFAHRVDAIVERPNTGQHDGARAVHALGALNHLNVRAHLEQRAVDTAQVSGAIIEQGDHLERRLKR